MNLDLCMNCPCDKCLLLMFDHVEEDGSKPVVINTMKNPNVRHYGYEFISEMSMRERNLMEFIFEKEGKDFFCKYHKTPTFSFDLSQYSIYLPNDDENKGACPYYTEHLMYFLNREEK